MQKLIAFLLSVLLIFSLCSCKTDISATPEPENLPTNNTIIEKENSKDNNKTEDKKETPSDVEKEKEEPKNEGQIIEPEAEPQTPLSPPQTEPEISDITINVINHTALSKEQYYQYTHLSDIEKEVYNEFCIAAEKCKNFLDLKKYNLNKNQVKRIYDAFLADNPQYFYVSKYCVYIIDSINEKVTEFILQYTDGTVIDTFDDKNNPIKLADRQKINSQIVNFTEKISAILSNIPSNVTELEREKAIYEYIADTVIYDSVAEDSIKNNPDYISFSITAYGAACKGAAVCEGYVKLLQYLCYNTGINATPVESGPRMQHMWAAVKIDNNWYMTDITWDDTDDELICTYKYFNVTTLMLSFDHSFNTDLKVPLCNSDKASFYNNYALTITDNNYPQNYEDIIKNSDKYIYIYRGENSDDLKDFINKKVYEGEVFEYIKSLNWSLDEKYYHTSTYYYIPIIK